MSHLNSNQSFGRIFMVRVIIIAAALVVSSSALAQKRLNVCTDANGNTSFQDTPCADLPTTGKSTTPIAAKEMNAKVAAETIARYSKAMSSRDSKTIATFLTDTFYFVNKTKGGENAKRVGVDRYYDFMKFVTEGAKSYSESATCEPARIDGKIATANCKINQQIVFLSNTATGKNQAEYAVRIEGGLAKIDSITLLSSELISSRRDLVNK
jgi:hypothetical protein